MFHVEHIGPVARLAMDRPDQRNALTPTSLAALSAHAREVTDAGARALILAGEGKSFCAGFDLTLCKDDPNAMRELLTGLSKAIVTLRSLPIPVVAAVQGAAIAGGAALLGGADVVVADRDAKIGYPVVRIGVSPAVSAPFMQSGIGDGPTRARMLDTELISGERAHEIGLVHELVDSRNDVAPRALELANDLAAKPAGAMAVTKSWCMELADASMADRAFDVSLSLTGGDEERELLEKIWSDHR